MFKLNIFSRFILILVRTYYKFRSADSQNSSEKNILILFSQEKLGTVFSSRNFFKSIKNNFPESKIVLVLNSENTEKVINYNLQEILGLENFDEVLSCKNIFKIISLKYDSIFLPTIEAFSVFSHLILTLVRTNKKFGVSVLDGEKNPFDFVFSNKIKLGWKTIPDNHLSEFLDAFLRQTKFRNIENETLIKTSPVNKLLSIGENKKIIIINNEPEELKNKWSTENLVKLISKFVSSGDHYFYYIEENIEPEIKRILESEIKVLHYINKNNFKEILEIISISDLVITCDSTIMHLAGLFNIPQISIFGITNPFNWAPIGPTKKFIKKSDLINDVTSEDIFELSQILLKKDFRNE